MIILPAIDLHDGKCVRLLKGRLDQETIYSDDPVAMALRWQSAGAEWLHLVDLDGAFEGSPRNHGVIGEIVNAINIPVEVGGGIRSLETIAALCATGVQRVILGTVAIKNPELISAASDRFGTEAIVVGIDARDGWVATEGWVERSAVTAVELALAMKKRGIGRVIYTDIARDGTLAGVNVTATVKLAQHTGLQVIASGGVSSLEDIRQLVEYGADGIEGVIVGQAIYTGALDLTAAINLCKGS